MIDKEKYLREILKEVERRKQEGKNGVFRVGAKVDFNTVMYVADYFDKSPDYTIDLKERCAGCKNIWDISIYFTKFE